MALASKKTVTPKTIKCSCEKEKELKAICARYEALEAKLEEALKAIKVSKPAVPASINKIESWYEKEEPKQESEGRLRLNFADKLQSMTNAIKILPPNLVDGNGRHLATNIGAICGFSVTDEMMEAIYGDINESKAA